MSSLVHTRDQGTVETVDFTRRTYAEKGEDCPIGRNGDDHRFLGFTRCDLHRLPGERQNGHRALLWRIIGPIRRRIAEKRPNLVKKKCSSTMTTHRLTPQSSPRQIGRIALQTTAPSTVFGLVRRFLILFPNLKKSLAG